MANSIFLAATTAIPGGVTKLVGVQEPKNFHCNTQLSKLYNNLELPWLDIFRSACAIPDDENDQVYITGGKSLDTQTIVRYNAQWVHTKKHLKFFLGTENKFLLIN